jgi:hypothetical protein
VGPRPACILQKGCTRLPAASDKVYQLLVHGRWTFPGIPASSTTKTGYDIAEILLKVAVNTINQSNKSSTVDRGFEFRSFQSKHYAIGICCFSSKHWLDRNQGNESECGDMSIC